MYKEKWLTKVNIIIITLVLAGCSPTIDSRGYNIESLDLSSIKIGIDTQQTIQERLGTPSTVSVFSPNQQGTAWYYISKKTSTTAFYRPDTLEQQTIVIHFDAQGIVRDVKQYKGEHAVEIVKRTTETSGYESSALRDIFGNFGRYSGPTKTR